MKGWRLNGAGERERPVANTLALKDNLGTNPITSLALQDALFYPNVQCPDKWARNDSGLNYGSKYVTKMERILVICFVTCQISV